MTKNYIVRLPGGRYYNTNSSTGVLKERATKLTNEDAKRLGIFLDKATESYRQNKNELCVIEKM